MGLFDIFKTNDETPQQSFTPEYTVENFFGINLKTSPDESWVENRYAMRKNDSGEILRSFEKTDIADISEYFESIEAKVIGNHATNFFFRGYYDEDNAFDVFFLLERDFIHKGGYTNTQAARDFRGRFESLYDSIDWDFDNMHVVLDRDIDTEEMMLSVWTNFYNADYLDNIPTTLVTSDEEPKDSTVDETGNGNFTNSTIVINVNATLSALQETQRMMQAMLSGEQYSLMVVKGDSEGNYRAVDTEDFSEKFTFTCDTLSGVVNPDNVVLIAFKNMVKLEGTEMILECYCVSTPIAHDAEIADDIQTVYKMWYWMNDVMDGRNKTMKDGKINFNVAGLQYRENIDEIMNSVEEGSAVELRPDPTNEYDPNAMAFYNEDDLFLGYLPKKDQPFANLFLKSGTIPCYISEKTEDTLEVEFTPSNDMLVESVLEDVNMHFEKATYVRGADKRIRGNEEHIDFETFKQGFKAK